MNPRSRSHSIDRILLPITVCLLCTLLVSSAVCSAKEAPANALVNVPLDAIQIDDGDSIHIRWKDGVETVRLLSIDAPEVQHLEHNIPRDQPYGRQARAFLKGCLAMSDRAELLRAKRKDPYGRTLGYLLLNGKNYSELVLRASLAIDTSSRYPSEGFIQHETACKRAGLAAEPVPFEDPSRFRRRMRKLSDAMKAAGTYPKIERDRKNDSGNASRPKSK